MNLSNFINQCLSAWLKDTVENGTDPKVQVTNIPLPVEISETDFNVDVSSKTEQVVTTTATLILPANPNRLCFELQNEGVAPCLILMGAGITTSNYHINLTQASGTRTGDGAIYTETCPNVYLGAVYGLVESGSTTIRIYEKERSDT